MIKIEGRYNTAICYTDELEHLAREQILTVCESKEFEGSKIRIMPDVHAGRGCTIGTTMTIKDRIVPGMVGVDIGCGMETTKLADTDIDYTELDKIIREKVPAGYEIRKDYHEFNDKIDLGRLKIANRVKLERARRSIGTLGGGNHFIEVGRAEDSLYLVVHSGSRHLGSEVADYYQDVAYKTLCGNSKEQIDRIIDKLKAEGRHKEIAATIDKIKAQSVDYPRELAYVSGTLFDDYIHDMKITQYFAELNRKAITEVILTEMGLRAVENFTTTHNYIDTETMILRKGAVSAKKSETLLIPINMRDGSLLCVGKGNEDWNSSAPHGAGRLMSRRAALKSLSLEEFQTEMANIFTTSVNKKTLDEAPMAYKSMDEITKNINETVNIIAKIKPTYNFKSF